MSTWDVLARWADDRTRRDEGYRFERQLHVLKEESKRLENERVALHQEWEYQEEVARSEWEELQAERDDLIAQRDAAVAALKAVKWHYFEANGQRLVQCSWCKRWYNLDEYGLDEHRELLHRNDCQRESALVLCQEQQP